MKNLNRIGALCLMLSLILALAVPAFAAVEDTGFSDVDAEAWYAEAVMYCREHNLVAGIGDNQFAPESSLTRAQMATVLYRIEGTPAVTGTDAYTDTPDGVWYSDAVLWASQQELMGGYGGGLFGPDDTLTREQMTTVLWRYAGSPNAQGGNYSDAVEIASYAVTAAAWAHSRQIVRPVSDDVLAPKSAATRAQAADMLMRYNRSKQAEATVSDSLALINGGTFQMGSPVNEPERSSDEIQHSVTVSNFYMAKTEVSQAEYQAVMGNNPSETKGDNLPVTNITWYDAIAYCNKCSETEGLTPCYTVSGTTVTWNKSANGYPIWWGKAPKIISTFLESYDFSGKTIVPFCTSGSSGIGSSARNLHSLASNATWLDGQRFSGNASRSAVESWVNGLDLTLAPAA